MYSVYQPLNYLYKSPWFPRLTEVSEVSLNPVKTRSSYKYTYSIYCVFTDTLCMYYNTAAATLKHMTKSKLVRKSP